MRGLLVGLIVAISLCAAASADVFSMGGTRDAQGHWTGLASLETVPVGNPGNAGELSGSGAGGVGPDRVCGAVDYAFRMGKFEVTAGQYKEFLNAVAKTDTYSLYNTEMWDNVYGCKIQRIGSAGSYTYSVAADRANRPVNWVSWYDAIRFANWVQNGQGSGDTESGTYTITDGGPNSGNVTVPDAPTRGAWTSPHYVLPSEDEWYKPAYYDPNKSGGAGYWNYPTRTDAPPDNGNPDGDSGNTANYYDGDYAAGSPYWTTDVGKCGNSQSAYGTFDQGGNVWEWNDSILDPILYPEYRGLRGGSFGITGGAAVAYLEASLRYTQPPDVQEDSYMGFRIASVPEPFTLSLLALGGLAVLRRPSR